jgi:hypothetical protein
MHRDRRQVPIALEWSVYGLMAEGSGASVECEENILKFTVVVRVYEYTKSH